MNCRKYCKAMLIISFYINIFFHANISFAFLPITDEMRIKPLKGLKQICHVSYTDTNKYYDIKHFNINNVILKLIKIGLQSVDIKQKPTSGLVVKVYTDDKDVDGYILYNVMIQLNQEVVTKTENPIITYATTWEIGQFGFAPKDRLNKKIENAINECFNRFIDDYLSANSK